MSAPEAPLDRPPDPEGDDGGRSGARPGTATFTIEGRQAPALFVVGWLATLLGAGTVLVAILSGGGSSSTVIVLVGLVVLSIGLIAGAGSQGIERRARGTLPYVGPSPLLVFAASIPVSIVVGVIVAVPFGLAGIPFEGPAAILLAIVVQALVYVGIVRLLVVDPGALSWRAMGVTRLDGTALAEIGGGSLAAIPVILVTAIVAQGLIQVFRVSPESPLPPTGEPIGFTLSLLAGVVVAPLGEEVFFRGFATTAWIRGLGRPVGIVLTALVFAFAHVLPVSGTSAGDAFGLAVVGFGTRVPVALALGWLFVRRGTIWASFGLHAAFNAVLLILAEAVTRPT